MLKPPTKKGLTKSTFNRNRRWEVDNLDPQHGYVTKLKAQLKSSNPSKVKEAEEALEFLNKFNSEYYDNRGLKADDALHNTDELRKSCYSRTNSANRDLVGIKASNGEGVIIADLEVDGETVPALEVTSATSLPEEQIDAIDRLLDLKLQLEK